MSEGHDRKKVFNMASNYWAKLWIETLDDPKVARLPDSSWRRFFECILLAKELDEGGYLPSVADIAWRLRKDETSVNDDMSRLALAGLVEIADDGRWFVTNFDKRQSKMSDAERQRRYRESNAQSRLNDVRITNSNANRYAKVTKRNTETETEKETETEGEGGRSRAPKPTPSLTANAHPAVKAMYQVTTYWPGDVTHPVIIEKLGDNPNVALLGRAYQLWMSSGYNPKNFDGIGEWYQELVRDPNWTPQARFKNGKATTAAAPVPVMKEVAPGLY